MQVQIMQQSVIKSKNLYSMNKLQIDSRPLFCL
jgi:hypothetical protein